MARTRLNFRQLADIISNRQNNTTNAGAQNGARVETGWGFILGTGASFASKAVSFQTAFASAPIVLISCVGYKDTSDPANIGDAGLWEIPNMNAAFITTTGFNAIFGTIDGSTVATSRRILFAWIAIGT